MRWCRSAVARVVVAGWRAAAVAALLAGARGSRARAQIAPDHRWLTLRTAHFRVHFTRETEAVARRAAADAEYAYAQLAAELHPPRGPIALVISDDADQSNGSATPFPTNRIVVYANPPVSESALRFTDDWIAMVVTHELTHIFHLDRSRGIWRLGQMVFGRSPYLFPNEYQPSWLTEGLAVYYESRLTGAGRIAGSEHRMIAAASAIEHRFPSLDQVSLASPNFPFGESAYAFGSLFVDYLARTRGADRIPAFVESSSAQLIPFLIDLPARRAFGVGVQRGYGEWRDSLVRAAPAASALAAPLPQWRDLTHDELFAAFPRWWGRDALVYTGSPGREFYAAWRVDTLGRRTSVGRRNTGSPQTLLPDGRLAYSQLDFTALNALRADLYVAGARGERRLTRAARLSLPDARADGSLIAVQTVPGASRLVRVDGNGGTSPLTGAGLDTMWSEPRWSHRGDRIAAIRWRRGGISEVVVLDTLGVVQQVFASGHAVQATPSWSDDDARLLYSSDRTGRAEVYEYLLNEGRERVLSTAPTGLFEPVASGDRLAAVLFRADGYHLGVGRCCAAAEGDSATAIASVGARPTPSLVVDTGRAERYSAWRYLVPRYWSPSIGPGIRSGSSRIGASTSAADPVGRHSLAAAFAVPTDNSGVTGYVAYSFYGFGLPILDTQLSRDWSRDALVADTLGNILGELRHRTDDASLLATWIRRRVRSSLSFTLGSGAERRTYATDPTPLLARFRQPDAFVPRWYPRAVVSGRYVRTRSAPFSISPEDGFTLGATARDRWRADSPSSTASLSVVGAATAYKALDLPGYAHHVLALRAAAGVRDARSNGYLEVGGTSGTPVQIIAGYTVGEGREDFGVRGFDPAALFGTRALAGSAEYRAPLVKPGSGVGALPVFLENSSLSFFGDFGSAWCASVTTSIVCRNEEVQPLGLLQHKAIASIGAELDVNAAVLSWDSPYRFRFGVAHPVRDDEPLRRARVLSAYFAAGLAF